MFDLNFNILYNMLLAYTLFCMLYLYSSVKISVDLMLIITHDSNVPFNSVRCIAMLKKYIEHTYLEHCTNAWIIPMENKDVHKQFHLILMSS